LEWHFVEGEAVLVHQTGQQCLIKAVGDNFAEVEFRVEEGTVRVNLLNLLKEFHPGDFVEVMGGRFQGQSGWVEGGSNTNVNIAVESRSIGSTEVREVTVRPFLIIGICSLTDNGFQSIEVHPNCLRAATVPFLHAQPTSDSESKPFNDPIPWIGTEILVSGYGNPMKGYRGVVKTVLCKQSTESGLRVVAQLAHLNPSCPYKTEVLDYDHVIEVQYVISGICRAPL
jgi:hypothetical protein